MDPRRIELPALKAIGIEVRTTNADEADPAHARIPAHWQLFQSAGIASKIPHRTELDVVLAVYTQYESDVKGAYSLILGAEVSKTADFPEGCVAVTVPPGSYDVWTSEGPMPGAVIEIWTSIWAHYAAPGAPRRAFTADMERWDARTPGRVEIRIAVLPANA